MRKEYFIDQMHNNENNFALKYTWDTSKQEKGVSGLNNMSMSSFNDPILLMSVNIRGLVHNTIRDK